MLSDSAARRTNENGQAGPPCQPLEEDALEHIIGSSDPMRRTLEAAIRVAGTDATVLIRGETGTGKELLAKVIHQHSLRRDAAFVTVSCGSIPATLLESELFGHTKGSFTGAFTHKQGKVEVADHGTLFLDEIGDMPIESQVGILRLLQEREVDKIGALAPAKVDVRIVAATHRNLEAMVAEGSFRQDLYYRLVVVPVELPPLRERRGDIVELLRCFFSKFRQRYGRNDSGVPMDLLSYFVSYDWPGNIRQLEHVVEQLVLLGNAPQVTFDELPDFLTKPSSKPVLPLNFPDAGLSLEEVEKALIIRALEKCAGNRTRAARLLDLTPRAISYRMRKHGIAANLREQPKAAASS